LLCREARLLVSSAAGILLGPALSFSLRRRESGFLFG
jgi:hypothetical protein